MPLADVPFCEDKHSHVYRELTRLYAQPHRHFHTMEHVESILQRIRDFAASPEAAAREDIDRDVAILRLAAAYHDAVYDPMQVVSNEESSVALMRDHLGGVADPEVLAIVEEIILATANLDYNGDNDLVHMFLAWDRAAVIEARSVTDLIRYGMAIFEEYSFHNYRTFLEGHFEIVRKLAQKYSVSSTLIDDYYTFMSNWMPKVALFPGSFNPFHNGHAYVCKEAEKIFDKVIVARGINPEKVAGGYTMAEGHVFGHGRWQENGVIKGTGGRLYQLVHFTGLVAELVRDFEAQGYVVTVVKGLRNGADLESELTQMAYTRDINPSVSYAYIPTPAELAHVSSSGLRALGRFGVEVTDYVP